MQIKDLQQKHAEVFAPRFRGFECSDGWAELADAALAELRRSCPSAKIVQAKEKFGGFRVYLENKLDEEAVAILQRAEAKSLTVCEICGAPGELRESPGRIRVRCDTHREE